MNFTQIALGCIVSLGLACSPGATVDPVAQASPTVAPAQLTAAEKDMHELSIIWGNLDRSDKNPATFEPQYLKLKNRIESWPAQEPGRGVAQEMLELLEAHFVDVKNFTKASRHLQSLRDSGSPDLEDETSKLKAKLGGRVKFFLARTEKFHSLTLDYCRESGAMPYIRGKGIASLRAPKWQLKEWYNLPEGKEHLEVTDFRGQTLVMMNFQSW